MTLKEETTIRRMPSFVWPYLANAEMLPRWNSKIRRIFPKESGPFRPHFQFDLILQVQGSEHEYTAEVVELVELRRIVIQMRSKTDPNVPVSTEIITLTPIVKGSKIERTTEVYTSEDVVSWWVKFLRRIFRSFRKVVQPKQEESLKRLAQLVEKGR